MTRPNDVFIFDGNLMVYRAVHQATAAAKSETKVWDNTTVAKVLSDVRAVLNKFMPSKVFFVWDGGHSKRRKQLFPEYKQTPSRQSRTADDFQGLRNITSKLTGLLRKLACRVLSIPGKEADDVIYFLVTELGGGTVVSDDRDFFQLINYGARIYRPGEDKIIAAPFYQEDYGILPEQILLAKAIIGDPGDNLHGVNGVGEVTVTKLLQENPWVRSLKDLETYLHGKDPSTRREMLIFDNLPLVERNMKMMDFREEVFSTDEASMIRRAMLRPVCVSEDIHKDFAAVDMVRALSSLASWTLPFRRLD